MAYSLITFYDVYLSFYFKLFQFLTSCIILNTSISGDYNLLPTLSKVYLESLAFAITCLMCLIIINSKIIFQI